MFVDVWTRKSSETNARVCLTLGKIRFDHYLLHIFRFSISIQGGGGGGIEDEISEEGSTSTGTIIIITIVILVLISLISGALVFYSKKNEIWCFQPTETHPIHPPARDLELQDPLQNENNETPIIRPQMRRPTEI